MRTTQYLGVVLSMSLVGHAWAQSNIDPEHNWAWSENCGWTNWQHDAPELSYLISRVAPSHRV